VKDAVVASPLNKFKEMTDGDHKVFEHGSLGNSIAASVLKVQQPGNTNVELHVNHQLGIAVSVNDKAPENAEVGATFTFPGAKGIYGIPERAVDLALKSGHKYRLWNLDVFRYQLEDTKGIYGTIPYLMAHSGSKTVGMLWNNAGDTTVGIDYNDAGIQATWTSLSGSIEIFFFPGPTPMDVLRQMAYLTGKQYFPPLFSMGYHQCRWNYRSEEDTLSVDEGFDTHDIPYDVIWLDIEHTDGKRYFTWDSHNFPNPELMQEKIAAKGRKMVTITDPHIKRAAGYHIFDEATANGYFVKNPQGTADYEGHCWPGTSSWLDFTNPTVRDWYATMFKYDKYKGSTPILYTWIDMNEPSVFNSHEVTMDINAQHHGGVAHKDVHNQYGFYQTMATYAGQMLRSQGPPHDTTTRPFLLSRSFFTGTQRYGAIWTGDNEAKWSHLEKATPMLLTMSLSALSFVGADVGGFFDNPPEELLVRWYQAAAYTPFFRGHAHLETKRREPWLFGEENTRLIRNAIRSRYRVLPYIYTTFYKSSQEGLSVISPLFFHWPADEKLFTLQDQFMLGNAVLVRPIASPRSDNHGNIEVYLPGEPGEKWYDFNDGTPYAAPQSHVIVCDDNKIPVFQRPGTIVPLRERARRSTTAMRNDPFTLQIALDSKGQAAGSLYLDDTHSHKFQNGAFVHRAFHFAGGRLTASEYTVTTQYTTPAAPVTEQFSTNTWFERIRIYGLTSKPNEIYLEHGDDNSFNYGGLQGVDAQSIKERKQLTFEFIDGVLTIRKPVAYLMMDWVITIA
jgi:alpha 1,3-glucosidase